MSSGVEQSEAPQFLYELLERWPDPLAENLFAFDATDRLLIDTVADQIADGPSGSVVVVGDRYGALTLASVFHGATDVRVHQDSFGSQMALAANAKRFSEEGVLEHADFRNLPLGPELLSDAQVVLIQLPKDLAQLDHWVELIARYASPSVQVYAGGRIKHMTKAMNLVFERHFRSATVSLARQKSRLLMASGVRVDLLELRPDVDTQYDPQLDLWICSVPGVFASGRVDIASRYLAQFIAELPPSTEPGTPVAADLGCGTGVLSVALLRARPEYHLIATDRSDVAVRSAAATLQKNAPEGNWKVRQDHALSAQPDGSLDLIVCNPPFHSEASISTELSEMLFEDAGRALKPGGVMLTVFNSHLPHRSSLERLVGPTEQLGRNPKFTVTKSVKRLAN